MRYNPFTFKFYPLYFFSATTNKKEKIVSAINAIQNDKDDNLLIAINGGGLLIKRKNKQFAEQVPYSSHKYNYDIQSIKCIDNKSFVFISGLGICLFNSRENSFNLVNNEIKFINAMEADLKGNLWLGNEKGLYQFDINNNQLKKVQLKNTQEHIISLLYTTSGELWVGSESAGLIKYNPKDSIESKIYTTTLNNIPSKEIAFALYEDKENRKWIGTLRGGIDLLDNYHSQFKGISVNKNSKNTLANNFIYSFFEDSQNNLYVGTDGGGLSVWNRNTNIFTNYKHQKGNTSSLSNDIISSIITDSYGDIWIATFGGGINKFNKSNGTFKHILSPKFSTNLFKS